MRKRYIIAGTLLAGITVAAVAGQLGVSRSQASREANTPGTRCLIAGFEANRERFFNQRRNHPQLAKALRRIMPKPNATAPVSIIHVPGSGVSSSTAGEAEQAELANLRGYLGGKQTPVPIKKFLG